MLSWQEKQPVNEVILEGMDPGLTRSSARSPDHIYGPLQSNTAIADPVPKGARVERQANEEFISR